MDEEDNKKPDSEEVDEVSQKEKSDEEILRFMRLRTRRSFLVGGVAAAGGILAWKYLFSRALVDGIPYPLRSSFLFNEKLSRAYFDPSRLAKTFPKDQAVNPRANGRIGISEDLSFENYKIMVSQDDASVVSIALNQIYELPKLEITTEFKCIEGWSEVVSWGGAKFSDFVAKYYPIGSSYRYVSIQTPDKAYYVGLDIETMMHSQTLLCYEVNGDPLTESHGAPIRLITPLKYGIKNIKQIGSIAFTNTRPADYWAERGYDWYSGL
jgi:DMSO/TMAO reductase YedYZ molybdopterin-dependent catalytic subunit